MREEIAEVRPRAAGFQVSIEHLWLGLPVFALLWKSFLFPLPFLDFWWHLKIGEVIATTRSIPRIDLFSFTAAGQPFIVQNWLAELLYYATYRLGGFPLLVFLNALMAAAAFLFVYHLIAAVVRPLPTLDLLLRRAEETQPWLHGVKPGSDPQTQQSPPQ